MTNTKFRKRVLLSSVAMLLIALVALGSATFAWFSSNPTVNATAMTGTAAVSSSLMIAHREYGSTATYADITSASGNTDLTKTWSKSIVLNSESISLSSMQPVSPVWGAAADADPTFYLASSSGTDATVGTMANDTVTGTDTSGTNYYRTQIWLKSSMTGIASVTATASISGDGADYARVAILPVAAKNSPLVLATNGDSSVEIASVTSNTATFEASATTYSNSGTLTDISAIDNGQCYYVFVWFEGQDEDCADINAGQGLQVSLTFTQA